MLAPLFENESREKIGVPSAGGSPPPKNSVPPPLQVPGVVDPNAVHEFHSHVQSRNFHPDPCACSAMPSA